MAWVLKSNRPPGEKRSSFFDELKYLAQAILGRDEEISDVAAPDLAAPSDVLFAEPRRPENVLLRGAFEEDVPEPTAPVEPIEYRLPPEFALPRGASRQLPVVSRAYQDSPKARFIPAPQKKEDKGPGIVSELLNIPPKIVSAFAEPISRYLGATDEQERAIREYLESWGETVDLPVDPEDVPNPFMLIPEDFFTPEQWNRLGRALVGFGEALNPLTALPTLAKAVTPDFLKEFARKQIHGVGHQFLRASPELDKSVGGAIMGGELGALLGGPPGAALGALVGGLTDLSGPAATFAEQLYAASGAPEEEFRAWLDYLYPEGAPDTQNIRNQLLAELFDPLTYVGEGLLKNAIANAASSAIRPFGYDDESTPLERALFGFAATPALAGAFKLAGRAAGAAGRGIALPALMVGEDVASRIVREAETASAIRSLERALDVAERRGAPAETIEGIRRQIERAAAGAPARSTRFTRAAGRALSAADQVPAGALAAGGAAVGATVGIGRQFANRLAESGDEQLEQHASEPSPVRERNNALIASAALVGALIAGRRRVDDLLDDELRSALRYLRDGPEFVVSAAIGGRTLQGRPVTGETHADAWARLAIERGLATPEDEVGVAVERALNAGLGGDEGFVTSRGRFVSRAEAKDLLYGRTRPSDEGDALIAEELEEDVSTAELRRVFRSLEDAARLRGIDPDNPEHLLDTKEWRQRRRESRVGHPYPDGNDEIARAALQFVHARRPDAPELTRVRAIDEDFAKRVADWYESARSNPDDPEVRAAYAQFVKELEEQAEMLRQMGYEMEPVMEDPYPNSFAMMRDLLDKKRIKVYAGETEHPILTHDQQVLFRWVHDVLGHGGPGNQFGPVGEENAYREHARMFSPLARRVLATETRGQNSWVNYGPHLRRPDGSIPQKGDPDYIPPIRRPYAEQKAVLMPEELVAPYSDPRALERLGDIFAVAKTVSELHRENGGSTWNFFHGNMSGKPYYAASIYPDRAPDVARSELVDGRDLPPEVIEAFVRRNADLLADERNSLGTWYDPEADKTYLEVSITTPDRDMAVKLGQRYNQKAIYNLRTGEAIPTGGTGEPDPGALTTPAIFRLLRPISIAAVAGTAVGGEEGEDIGGVSLAGAILAGRRGPLLLDRVGNEVAERIPAARKKIAEVFGKQDPTIVGAAFITSGARSFDEFAGKMRAEYGDRVEGILDELYDASFYRAATLEPPKLSPKGRSSLEVARELASRRTSLENASPEERLRRLAVVGANDAVDAMVRLGDARRWYREDIQTMEELTRYIFPETGQPEKMGIFKAILAILSNGNNPVRNYESAAEVYAHYRQHGRMPERLEKAHPRAGTHVKQLQKLQKLIDAEGEKGALDFLSAVVKSARKEEYGAVRLLGPKIGRFYLNTQGIRDEATIDVWAIRAFRRILGHVKTTVGKTGEELLDRPVSEKEAAEARRAFAHIAKNLSKRTGTKFDTADVQALLWYYEKELYRVSGARDSGQSSFADAAAQYIAGQPLRARDRIGPVGWDDYQPRRRGDVAAAGDLGPARADAEGGGAAFAGGSPRGAEGDRVGPRPAASRAGRVLSVATPVLAAQAFSEENDYNGYGAALASIGLVGANPRAASRALRKFEPDTERYFLWRKTPWSHYGTTYEFETPVGDVAVDVAHHGEELVIRWMGHPSHDMNRRVHLGVEGVRHVLSQVLRDYPQVKTLRATRVSGVREGRGLGKQGLVKDIKRLREAGLLGAAGVLAAQAAGEDEEAAALLAIAPFVGRPRFYSRLEAAVERGPEKTTVAKWLKLVQTQAHKQERRWTGIEDWLKSQGNKSLTRDEVLDFVRQNGIGLGERVLLDDPEPSAELVQKAAEWQALSSKRSALRNELKRAMQNAGYSEDQVEQYLRNPFGRLTAPTAEQERMLKNERRLLEQLVRDHDDLGLENTSNAVASIERSLYAIADDRALFDVDQVVKGFDWGSEKEAARATRIFNRMVEAYRKFNEALKTDGPPDVQEVLDKYAEARHAENRAWNQYLDIEHEHRRANAARFGGGYTLPGGENYREILITLSPESARGAPFKVPEHWGDIENVVVHVRLDDRTLPNGEKVLFIEEIQSDWQQRGREEGFGSSKFLVRTPDGVREYSEQDARMLVRTSPGSYELIGPSVSVGVPDMPFRESADVLGLAWKRILDEAIEGGYDRIAWTTGEQQVKRYDLSRYVDELVFDEKSGRKAGMGTIYGLVDGVAVVSEDVAREDLPRYIGKELADRMLTEGWDPEAGVYRLDSGAMVVDPAASGLSHFYDRTVPEWIQSYAKKNGVVLGLEKIDIGDPGNEAPLEVPSIRISGGVGRKLAEEGFPILGTAGILAGALPANEREDVDEIKLAALGLLAGKKPSNLSDPVRRVLSRVDRGGLPDLEPKRRLEKAYTYWIDHLYPIKRATTDVAKRIGERKPEFDAEMLARAAQGDHGYAAEVLKRGVHPPGTLERRTRGLEEIYSELGERQEDLIAYRIARRALELMDPNRPGGPRTTGFEGMEDQLRLVVRQFESDPLIHRIHEELKDYHKQWLKLLEEEGVLRSLTKEEREEGFESLADLIESRGNREYTPFFRTKKQAERVFGPAKGGKRLANLPTPVKRLLGSERPIIDPMESDIRMTFVYSTLVMRQRVANALAEIAENVPDQPWIQRIRAPMQRVSFSKEQLKGQIDDELLDNIEPEHLSVFTRRPLTQRDQIISVNGPDGKRRYYEVEPMLYEALMGMSGHQVTAAVRLLSLPASILRTGVTITPDFAIANFIRDALQTAVTSDAKGPPPRALVRAVNDGLRGLAALMVAGNPGALKRTAKAAAFGGAFGALVPTESEDRPLGAAAGAALAGAFAAGARGIARGGRLFGRRGVTETMKPEDIISLWRSSGGDYAAYLSMDRRSIRDAIRQMRKQGKKFPVAWTPMDAIRAIGETARGLGETFENATRVGEFMAQLDRAGRVDPLAATSAAVFSRDVSTDFKRHGAGIVVEILRPMAAFWNARVQGLDKIRRQARVNPKRVFPTLFLTITAPSMALYALNTKLTEEDPERWDYWDRPMWERNMFWLVPLPDGGYLRIPKPFELGLFFGSLPERMVEAFDPRNPHRGGMAEIGEQAWENFASLLSETFLPLPTAAVPWIENFVNFDLFTGRPIHSPYEAEELDPRLKGREKSSEVAGRLSDLQGAMADVVSRKIPVLTSFAEWLQMTPAEIDNVLRDYTGSLGREVVHGLDRALRDEETRGKPPAPQRSQRPLTGRFFGDVPYPYGEHVEQFYSAKTAAEGAKATFDRLVEMGRMEQAGAFFERQAGKMTSADMGQEVAGQLSQLRELRKLVESDPTLTPEEKRKEIDEINRLMSELARETGQLMRELQRESAKR